MSPPHSPTINPQLAVIILCVVKAPVITEHPRDKDTADLVGDEVSFTVKAQGRGLRFKWKKDGRPLPQALVRGARGKCHVAS